MRLQSVALPAELSRREREQRSFTSRSPATARSTCLLANIHFSTMDPPGPSTSQLPASFSKYHHPYFAPAEVEYFSEKQRGKLSVSQEEKARQQACGFIEAVGSKIGLYVLLCHRVSMSLMSHQSPEDYCDGAELVSSISPVLCKERFQLPCQWSVLRMLSDLDPSLRMFLSLRCMSRRRCTIRSRSLGRF